MYHCTITVSYNYWAIENHMHNVSLRAGSHSSAAVVIVNWRYSPLSRTVNLYRLIQLGYPNVHRWVFLFHSFIGFTVYILYLRYDTINLSIVVDIFSYKPYCIYVYININKIYIHLGFYMRHFSLC